MFGYLHSILFATIRTVWF
uniref:Uncharacterized protein n=1 Tax=Rhizophora mucronata TaxID=61149 RepID=A0A2P2N0Z5_RHIMU